MLKIGIITFFFSFILLSIYRQTSATQQNIPCIMNLENGQKITGTIPKDFITGATVMGTGEWIGGDKLAGIKKLEKTDNTLEEYTFLEPGSGCGDLHASWTVYRITTSEGKTIEVKILLKDFEFKSDYPPCYSIIPLTTQSGVKVYPLQERANDCKKVTKKSPDNEDFQCLECNIKCPAVAESIKMISFE
jgi:hypothetical protein